METSADHPRLAEHVRSARTWLWIAILAGPVTLALLFIMIESRTDLLALVVLVGALQPIAGIVALIAAETDLSVGTDPITCPDGQLAARPDLAA